MCRCLQVPVGTGLIAMEWAQFVTPCIRKSRWITALWFGACSVIMSPLFLLYLIFVLAPELVIVNSCCGSSSRRHSNWTLLLASVQ